MADRHHVSHQAFWIGSSEYWDVLPVLYDKGVGRRMHQLLVGRVLVIGSVERDRADVMTSCVLLSQKRR